MTTSKKEDYIKDKYPMILELIFKIRNLRPNQHGVGTENILWQAFQMVSAQEPTEEWKQ